jgi:hypothetical protein
MRDDREARWRAGDLDDETFERGQRARARNTVLVVVAVFLVGLAAWSVNDRRGRHLEVEVAPLLLMLGFVAFLGGVLALRAGRFAHAAARNLVLQRNRARVEANPAQPLTARVGRDGASIYGRYRRSPAFAYRVLGAAALCLALTASLGFGYGVTDRFIFLAALSSGLALWGLFIRLDRRVYLDVSAEGISCRPWGPQRLAFGDFKAVYPRRNSMQTGIVFVPRALDELRRKLPWYGRLALRSGGGVQAHVGTLTLWTTRVGVARDPLLRGVQAEILRAAPDTKAARG